MTTLTYKDGIEINQVTRQQITLRGKGDGAFAFAVNKEVSLLPPSDNLRMAVSYTHLTLPTIYSV